MKRILGDQMTNRNWLAISAVMLAAVLVNAPAIAADKEHPDWPCVQKKVETLGVSQIWDGPSIEGVTGWLDDDDVRVLIANLMSRKIPEENAQALIKKFADAQPDASREARLTLVFAGLFDGVENERKTLLAGIEKFNRRQKERAVVLEAKGKAISELEAKASSDEAAAQELAKAQEDFDWETRIFQERNNNIPIACELPGLIDQRLYALAHYIRSLMKS